MAYAEYTFYTTEYKGSAILQADFAELAERASDQINALTFNRAKTVAGDSLKAVKFAVCAVAEALQDIGQPSPVGVTSEKVGGHSITYADYQSRAYEQGHRMYAAAAVYLSNTGLLYRGVGRC